VSLLDAVAGRLRRTRAARGLRPARGTRREVSRQRLFQRRSQGRRRGGRRPLGAARCIFTGPTTPTAEGQIEVLNALIAQHVDVIAISANDPDAVVPTLQRAMQRGIKVISYDSAVAQAGRNGASGTLFRPAHRRNLRSARRRTRAASTGKIAVISATPTSTNQNSWLAEMSKALPQYPGLTLVGVAYGDDCGRQVISRNGGAS